MGPVVYSPGRAQQLRLLLWSAVVMAAVATALALWVVIVGGSTRFALFVALPNLLLLVLTARTLQLLEDRGRGARFGAVGVGVLLLLIGLVLASAVIGIIPSIIGILVLLLALLPDVGDQ